MMFKSFWKQHGVAMSLTLAAWFVYAVLSLLAPYSANNSYHLSSVARVAILITVILPILVIWLLAARGVARLRRYSLLIQETVDGRAMRSIAVGIGLIVVAFVSDAIIGATRTYFIGSDYLDLVVFLKNHLSVFLSLGGFLAVWQGTRKLLIVSGHPVSVERFAVVIFPYFILAGLFAWSFYHQLDHIVTNGVPNYALPGSMPFYTIALPSIMTWILGIAAIINMVEYARRVKGKIYRTALKDLAYGLATVIGFSIFIQILSVSTSILTRWRLGPILVLIYILLVLYAVGFVFIDRGARKLIHIEVVT